MFAVTQTFYSYANYLTSIFIYDNENIRNKIKAHKNVSGVGYTNKMTHISTANCPRLQTLVPNEC